MIDNNQTTVSHRLLESSRRYRGDARHLKCVNVDNNCRWIDFYQVGIPLLFMSAVKDLNLFLTFIGGANPSKELVKWVKSLSSQPTTK